MMPEAELGVISDKNLYCDCETGSRDGKREKLTLEDFAIGRLLGEGNFSKVLVADHLKTKEKVALKVVELKQIESMSKTKEALMEKHCLMRLNREAYRDKGTGCAFSRYATQPQVESTEYSHGQDHVIKLYHTFKTDFELCFVNELCEGNELWDEVKYIGTSYSLVKWYFSQILCAVEYVHSKDIVHRDLKAENVALHRPEPTSIVKLLDFGSALDLSLPAKLTVAGNSRKNRGNCFLTTASDDQKDKDFLYFVGTANFMAPEAQNNQTISNVKSDIWSLGGMLYQIATGGAPFGAPSEFLTFVRSNNIDLDIPCYLDPTIEHCILSCLRENPEERPNANEIWSYPFMMNAGNKCMCDSPAPELDPFERLIHSRKLFYRGFIQSELFRLEPSLTPPDFKAHDNNDEKTKERRAAMTSHEKRVPIWIEEIYPGRSNSVLQKGSACKRAQSYIDSYLMSPGGTLWYIVWDRIGYSAKHACPLEKDLHLDIVALRDCTTSESLVAMVKDSVRKRQALDLFCRLSFDALRSLSTGSRADHYYDDIAKAWVQRRESKR